VCPDGKHRERDQSRQPESHNSSSSFLSRIGLRPVAVAGLDVSAAILASAEAGGARGSGKAEGAARARPQVLLERCGALFVGERDDDIDVPGPAERGMPTTARVVRGQTCGCN